MDSTENISARVLLKRILVDEPPRTPVTNSAFQGPGTSGVRYSARLRRKSAEAQTPQDIVRRSQKQKIRESISKKSLPPIKRRTASIRNANAFAGSSVLISEGDTPRHLLRNILLTEPLKSPVVHKRGPTEEPEPSSPDDSITRTHPSIELSGLDLPDLTFRNAESTVKVLGRKRPRRSLNITAFEKRLKDGDDDEEERENVSGDHSSLSLSSSTSLSLKTPFVEIQTEKKVGLRRRVASRRKVTEEEFGAAIDRQMGDVHRSGLAEKTLGGTAHIDEFTLGLSKLGEPDVTTDIVTCSTALYNQQDSMIAIHDKSTVLASQLQRKMEQSCLRKGDSVHAAPGEAEAGISPEHIEEEGFGEAEGQSGESNNQSDGVLELSEPEEEEGAAGSPTEEELGAIQSEGVETSSQDEEEAAAPQSQPEEEGERPTDSQTEEEGERPTDSQTEEEGERPTDSQTEEEGERPTDSQTEEEGERPTDSQTEEEGERPTDSQTEEEGERPTDSQTEEEGERPTDSQTEEDAAEASSSFEEEHADPRSHSDQDDQIGTDFADFEDEASGPSKHVEAQSSSEEDENAAQHLSEDFSSGAEEVEEEQLESGLEHITRQVDGFTRTFILPVSEVGEDLAQTTAAGFSHLQSKTKTSLEVGSPDSGSPHSWKSGQTQAAVQEQDQNKFEAGREEPFHLPGLTQDIEDSQHQSDSPPEEAQDQDAAEQEEWEDEDDGEESHEFSGKTPAFVKEKRTFFHPEAPTLTPLSKNVQLGVTNEVAPPAKPKQTRRKTNVPTGRGVLPKAYLMSTFRHFSKTKVSPDVYPVLNEIMNKFFDRMAQDLETYAAHAKRKTIDVEDAILLLRRQGYVNDKVPVEVLIEKYLRMEQRKLLIPIATSGNVVVPKKRR